MPVQSVIKACPWEAKVKVRLQAPVGRPVGAAPVGAAPVRLRRPPSGAAVGSEPKRQRSERTGESSLKLDAATAITRASEALRKLLADEEQQQSIWEDSRRPKLAPALRRSLDLPQASVARLRSRSLERPAPWKRPEQVESWGRSVRLRSREERSR